jgi:hypothetical protein
VRLRFPIHKQVAANVGYAHFWSGDFTQTTSQKIDANRKDDSNFFYVQISASAF